MTAPEVSRVVRTDATPNGAVSLVEYDHHGVRTWAVVATDQDGCLVSDLDDALLVTVDEAVDAYVRMLDHLHWLDTPAGNEVRHGH